MGKDMNFKKILVVLGEIHENFGELRFGNVVQSANDLSKKCHNSNLYDVSSKELLNSLIKFNDIHKIKRGIK